MHFTFCHDKRLMENNNNEMATMQFIFSNTIYLPRNNNNFFV